MPSSAKISTASSRAGTPAPSGCSVIRPPRCSVSESRTPLNAILGWSQLLRSGAIQARDLNEAFETIERNARVQAELIEELLDVSRIISGKLRLDVQPMDLSSVVDGVVESMRPAAD